MIVHQGFEDISKDIVHADSLCLITYKMCQPCVFLLFQIVSIITSTFYIVIFEISHIFA